jgi:ferrous iron transport protein B
MSATPAALTRVALLGNPNCGKTALFNLLTGSRQKVANYAGVTVERKSGRFVAPSGRSFELLDLPGAYSFDAASPDEAITRDVCRGHHPDEPRPDVLVCVVDATNLRLHLRFVLEVRQLGLPIVVAVNMADTARKRGIRIDLHTLQADLGLPVVETIAVRRGGAHALVEQLDAGALPVPPPVDAASAGDLHAQVRQLLARAVHMPERTARTDEALDRVLLHPVAGPMVLAATMFLIFQAVFAWAAPLQDLLAAGVGALSAWSAALLPPGPLQSLLTDGIFAGVGTVVEFLPQILLLFLFILVLEESGYLPRAAFLLDRPMSASGLSGRSFIPLLSSFACAIPGIMATRSIQNPRDRIATIMVAPLMTCSARLPVYTLLIGAFIPRTEVWRIFNLQGLVLFALYFAGIASALFVAWVMKRWNRGVHEHSLLLELPSYRLPHPRDIAIGLWERARIFMARVGGIILVLTVLLWGLSSFPAPPPGATEPAIEYSIAGRLGAGLETIFAPIGFNWQISIALVPGLAAREVAVSALATVYALSAESDEVATAQLTPLIASEWPLATALSLLVWFIYAPQCLSTLAVVRRETNSWRTVGIMAGYLFGLAYLASFVTYHVTRWLT